MPCARPVLALALAAGLHAAHGLEDAAALVQAAARSHSQEGAGSAALTGLLSSRLGMLASMAHSQWPQMPQMPTGQFQFPQLPTMAPYDCSKFPFMCQPPFNCNRTIAPDAALKKLQTMATKAGHANLRMWCSPNAAVYAPNLVQQCLVNHDLRTSAQAVFDETIAGTFGPFTHELDASYCFIEGHCSNTEVTYNTTIEEAEKMCDARYGHEGWAVNFGVQDMASPAVLAMALSGGASPTGGFKNARLTKLFLKAACAMGNYHCDVVYCRDTYCKKDYYIKKYGHLLPKVPGHLIQQRDWL